MKFAALPLMTALALATTPALADHNRWKHRDYYEPYPAPHYAAPTRGRVEYAQVVSTVPIYRSVRIEQPRRECWDEQVVYEEREPGYWMNNGVAGSLIGAIAGGVAGHQFGKGRGKDAATALGAVIGAGVGQRVAMRNSRPAQTVQHVGYEEVCTTVVDHRVEQRVEAYDVTYQYGGREYQTRMPYDPGARIPVDVNVRPVSY